MTEVIGKALATIVEADDDLKYGPHGGFTCIASTPEEDRDGDNLYQEEWKSLPDHITVDSDHGMSVATTVGSGRPFFNSEGNVQADVSFSSIPRAQEVRTLIKEGHIRTVSVAFMTDKTKKSGEPRRELLNLGIVAIPSNRSALILDSKALDARAEELAAQKTAEGEVEAKDAETKDSPQPYGDVRYADPEDGKYPIDTVAHIRAALAYINMPRNYEALGDHAAHVKRAIEAAARAHGINVSDKAVDGAEAKAKKPAVYIDVIPRLDQDALKSVVAEVLKAATPGAGGDHALVSAIHDASVHLGAQCIVQEPDVDPGSGADDGANKSAEGADTKDLDAFEKALDEVLPSDDSPAEAAAATDEVPAPAVEAADSKAKQRNRALGLLALSAS